MSNPLKYFDGIWYTFNSGQDSVSHARMVYLPLLPFELSPLNELYRGKLVLTLILIHLLRYFDDVWYTYKSDQDDHHSVAGKNVLSPLLAF